MSRADLWQFLFSIIKTLVDYWSCSFAFSLAFLDPWQGGMCSMGGCSTDLALRPGRLLVQGVQYQGERSDDSPLHSIWWDFREGTWSLKVKVVGFQCFQVLPCLPVLGCSIIKVVCDMMTEFANECFIACYSQSQNPATMKYSVVQVKDKLLEAWFMKYVLRVCCLNTLCIFH